MVIDALVPEAYRILVFYCSSARLLQGVSRHTALGYGYKVYVWRASS